jgi:hypothetical protein
VRLRSSPLLTPQWLAVEPPEDLLSIHAPSAKLVCPARPIRVLLDTSLPDLDALKSYFREAIPCAIDFQVTHADRYFRDFAASDLGVCWFTPDLLDLYNAFTSFDCSLGANCYFNWRDRDLQAAIDKVRKASEGGVPDKDAAIQVERILFRKGYVAPLAEMNWWIVGRGKGNSSAPKPIHPAGLFQVSARDFL